MLVKPEGPVHLTCAAQSSAPRTGTKTPTTCRQNPMIISSYPQQTKPLVHSRLKHPRKNGVLHDSSVVNSPHARVNPWRYTSPI